MSYRGIINLLMMCGCVGQSGGGWSHYVGQEKLRPQFGWAPLTFGLDWSRPPRQMNGTSFFYAHTGQYRHEQLRVGEILAPTADKKAMEPLALIDFNAAPSAWAGCRRHRSWRTTRWTSSTLRSRQARIR